MTKFDSKTHRRLLALTASAAAFIAFQAPLQVDAETGNEIIYSTEETAPAAEIVNEEANLAEIEAGRNNDLPDAQEGVEIGVKEWKSTDGQISDNRRANPRGPVKTRQNDQGQTEVEVGDQWIVASTEKPEVGVIRESQDPDRITNQLAADPSTGTNLAWYTRTAEPVPGATVRISSSADAYVPVEGATVELRTYKTYSDYFEKTPQGNLIYGYTTDDDPSTIELWSTDEDIVRELNPKYTAGDDRGYIPIQLIAETIYHADVRGLSPDTRYYYRVGAEGNWSDVGTFQTAAGKSQPFQFIQYTDTQNAYWNENVNNEPKYAKDTMERALELYPQADFALHTGDFVEIAQSEDEWVDIIGQTQDLFLKLPHAMTSGNHDAYSAYTYDGQLNAFNNHVNAPDAEGRIYQGSYYSFDYNGAHIVVLNTNDASDENGTVDEIISDEQFAWLREDLAANQDADWRIVTFHKPVFSGSYHSLQDSDVQNNRAELIEILSEYNVDLVMSGHDHVNSVTKPIVFDANAPIGDARLAEGGTIEEDDGFTRFVNPEGTVFVTLNTTGTKLYDDIYNESLDHIAKVRPRVAKALGATVEDNQIVAGREEAQANLDYWRNLFSYMNQPGESDNFRDHHDNNRRGTVQNFMTYDVTPESIVFSLYEVSGDLNDPEADRTPRLVNQTSIVKRAEENRQPDQPGPSRDDQDSRVDQDDRDDRDDRKEETSPVKTASTGQAAGAEASSQEESLPQTGAGLSALSLAAGSVLTGLGLALSRKRR